MHSITSINIAALGTWENTPTDPKQAGPLNANNLYNGVEVENSFLKMSNIRTVDLNTFYIRKKKKQISSTLLRHRLCCLEKEEQ